MSRSTQIQGLRALSVLLVLVFHADWLPGGYVGVDVFYVISGYLITNLIIKESAFSFKEFYARRAKRLLPAAYLVLFVTAIAFWFIAPVISRVQFARDLFSSTWYLSNINFAFWQNDYQNLGASPSPLIHYWSLAVEEQFYLVWPLIIWIFRRRLKSTVWLITLLSFLCSLIMVANYPIWAFYALPSRAFELGLGAILAIFKLKLEGAKFGIALILMASLLFDKSTNFPGWPALLPIFGAALVVTSTKRNLLLDNRFAQLIGDWSYSIYLWHWPLLVLPTYLTDKPLTNFAKFLLLFTTIIIAGLTYRFVEKPIRVSNIKANRIYLYVALCAFLLSILSLSLYRSGNSASTSFDLIEVRKQPIIYEDGCQMDKQSTRPNLECIYGDPNGKRSMILLGDSHAAQWFPALEIWAKSRSYKFYVMTKSSCPASALPLKDDGAFKVSLCDEYRKNAIKAISNIKPELLIVGSSENHKEIPQSAYLLLPKISTNLLVLQDTPWPNRDIPTCLSKVSDLANIKETSACVTSRPKQIKYDGFETFDPIPLLCNQDICPAIVDGIIAYRDHSHISVEMALHLSKQLSKKLDQVVAR